MGAKRSVRQWGVRIADAEGVLVRFFSLSKRERDIYESAWRDAFELMPSGHRKQDLEITKIVKRGPIEHEDGTITPVKNGDPWRCGACELEGKKTSKSESWHGPGSELCPLACLKEGDAIVVTDFENEKHDAILKRVTPIMHECDDEPCEHRIWAAEWPIEVPGADPGTGRRCWPIGQNWERVEAKNV